MEPEIIHLAVTKTQWEAIKAEASIEGISPEEFVRLAALEKCGIFVEDSHKDVKVNL